MKCKYMYTPGPWLIAGRHINSVSRKTIAIMGPENSYEMQTNANLIAMAPNLLEALETLLDNIPKQTQDADWWEDGLTKAVEQAKGVIAKARDCNLVEVI